ncbi:MAG TPA: GNAT family N-acetyltransferase [Casimicrobiaceae bacterium]|nr:GNAT family N-acetyltransferase [Casimicrobiaceae bacterium]
MNATSRATAPPDLVVRHNPAAHRFEAIIEGELCRANYRPLDDVLAMNHTEVPQRLRGRGIARALVAFAVEFARANGMRIAPYCSYVRGYFERHPEAHDVLAPL